MKNMGCRIQYHGNGHSAKNKDIKAWNAQENEKITVKLICINLILEHGNFKLKMEWAIF